MTAILALDLGTLTGWALRTADGHTVSGTESFNSVSQRLNRR